MVCSIKLLTCTNAHRNLKNKPHYQLLLLVASKSECTTCLNAPHRIQFLAKTLSSLVPKEYGDITPLNAAKVDWANRL